MCCARQQGGHGLTVTVMLPTPPSIAVRESVVVPVWRPVMVNGKTCGAGEGVAVGAGVGEGRAVADGAALGIAVGVVDGTGSGVGIVTSASAGSASTSANAPP